MEKQEIISRVKESCPNIDNLSDRTWCEVAEALERITSPNADLKDSIIMVFKSISGQIRHEISEQLEIAMKKNNL